MPNYYYELAKHEWQESIISNIKCAIFLQFVRNMEHYKGYICSKAEYKGKFCSVIFSDMKYFDRALEGVAICIWRQ